MTRDRFIDRAFTPVYAYLLFSNAIYSYLPWCCFITYWNSFQFDHLPIIAPVWRIFRSISVRNHWSDRQRQTNYWKSPRLGLVGAPSCLFRFGCFWFYSHCHGTFIERNAICCWIFLSSLFFPISLPLHEHCLDSKHFPYCAYVFWAVFGHLPSECSKNVLHT